MIDLSVEKISELAFEQIRSLSVDGKLPGKKHKDWE